MSLVVFINLIVFALVIYLAFYLIKLYYRDAQQKSDLQNYLNSATLLTSREREDIAVAMAQDEAKFKKSANYLLIGTLIGLISLCVLLLLAQNDIHIAYILLIYVVIAVLILMSYRLTIKQRDARIIEQLPNAIDLITHYTINNISITETMRAVSKQLPNPIAKFFQQVSNRIAGGETIANALRKSAYPYNIFQLNYFVMVLILQQETGADTIKILRRLVEYLRREKVLQQKIKSLKVDINAAQWGLGIVVLFMIFYIQHQKPQYFHAFLSSSLGFKFFIGAIVLYILGLLIIQRIMRVV